MIWFRYLYVLCLCACAVLAAGHGHSSSTKFESAKASRYYLILFAFAALWIHCFFWFHFGYASSTRLLIRGLLCWLLLRLQHNLIEFLLASNVGPYLMLTNHTASYWFVSNKYYDFIKCSNVCQYVFAMLLCASCLFVQFFVVVVAVFAGFASLLLLFGNNFSFSYFHSHSRSTRRECLNELARSSVWMQ